MKIHLLVASIHAVAIGGFADHAHALIDLGAILHQISCAVP